MDRRQKKTKAAIYAAFTDLLCRQSYESISISKIIQTADIGRTTFYAHYASKDDLLLEMCQQLFEPIENLISSRNLLEIYMDIPYEQSPFYQLLLLLKRNPNNIRSLLSNRNSEQFINYFKSCLRKIIQAACEPLPQREHMSFPADFFVNSLAIIYTEVVLWWLKSKARLSEEEVYRRFMAFTRPIILAELRG